MSHLGETRGVGGGCRRPAKQNFRPRLKATVEKVKKILRTLFEASNREEEFRKTLEELQIIGKAEAADFEANTVSPEDVNPFKKDAKAEDEGEQEAFDPANFDLSKCLDVKDEIGDRKILDSFTGGLSAEPLSDQGGRLSGLAPTPRAEGSQPNTEAEKIEPQGSQGEIGTHSASQTTEGSSGRNIEQTTLALGGLTAKASSTVRIKLTPNIKESISLIQSMQSHVENKCKEIHEVAKSKNPESLPEKDQKDVKYLHLARLTKIYQMEALNILRKVGREGQEVKLVFLVDNSGSMCGENIVMSLNCLVVLLESIKLMECATAVVKFGGEGTQEILKGFDTEMSVHTGQFILESFDCSEKTLPVDALKFVAESEHLYGSVEPLEHRFVVLITDGILTQGEKADYDEFLRKMGAELLVLVINFRKDFELQSLSKEEAEKIMNNVAKGSWLDIDNEKSFQDHIVDITEKLAGKLSDSLTRGDIPTIDPNSANLELVSVKETQKTILTSLQSCDIPWGSKVYVADLNAMEDEDFNEEPFSAEYIDDLQKAIKSIEEATTNEKDSRMEETELTKVISYF